MKTKAVIIGVIGTLTIVGVSSTAAVFYMNMQSPKKEEGKVSEVVRPASSAGDQQSEIELKANNEVIKAPVVTDTPKPSTTNIPSPTESIKPTNTVPATQGATVAPETTRQKMEKEICKVFEGADCQQGINLVSSTENKKFLVDFSASGDFYGLFPFECRNSTIQTEFNLQGEVSERITACKTIALNKDRNISEAYRLYKKYGYRDFYRMITRA